MSVILHSNCSDCGNQSALVTDLQSAIYALALQGVPIQTQKMLYVDVVYGNDSTGERENFIKPFATGAAAENAAQSGDTIIFRPGVHTISNLGKPGVTYEGLPGSTFSNSGSLPLFSDGGEAVTFYIRADKFSTTTASWIYCTNTASNVYAEVNELLQTDAAAEVTGVDCVCNVQLTCNGRVEMAATTGIAIKQSANKISFLGNYVKAPCTILHGAGGSIYYKAVYTEAAAAAINQPAMKVSSNGYLMVEDTSIIGAQGDFAGSPIIQLAGGTIEIVGIRCEATSIANSLVDLDATGNTLIFRDSLMEFKSSGDHPIMRIGDNENNKFIGSNLELRHLGITANCAGIYCNATNGAGVMELRNLVIKLHTTAVGLGAKAILEESGVLTVKAYSDIRSNGGFDGSNLISDTFFYTDANVKSDW